MTMSYQLPAASHQREGTQYSVLSTQYSARDVRS